MEVVHSDVQDSRTGALRVAEPHSSWSVPWCGRYSPHCYFPRSWCCSLLQTTPVRLKQGGFPLAIPLDAWGEPEAKVEVAAAMAVECCYTMEVEDTDSMVAGIRGIVGVEVMATRILVIGVVHSCPPPCPID